jgi:hypothetical protein
MNLHLIDGPLRLVWRVKCEGCAPSVWSGAPGFTCFEVFCVPGGSSLKTKKPHRCLASDDRSRLGQPSQALRRPNQQSPS